VLQPARRTGVNLAIDLGLVGFIIWKHRSNIQRLLAGTENRFGRRGGKPQAPAT
jgi:glycerol-3-phosphate acyltransferase PlsY